MTEVSLDSAPAPRRSPPRLLHAALSIIRRIHIGTAEIRRPDGSVWRAAGTEPGPDAVLIVHDDRLWGRMMRDGATGFCEAYVDGWWETPDLQAVLDVALLNHDQVMRAFSAAPLIRLIERIQRFFARNSRAGSRRNIMAHYDLGNDFYEAWLDGSMTYSSALFEHPAQTLEDAQRAKYAALCDRLGLAPGMKVLEIGCGWGGFAEFAARERGALVTGLTISPSQRTYAIERMNRAGLSDQVEIALRDYRDERGTYDRIASIEMFEAVGERYWPQFFDTVRARLAPGGLAALQVIMIREDLFDSYRRKVDFVQKHIFPGGMLPSPSAFQTQAERAGLSWRGMETFGPDYAETLKQWRRSFHDRWEDIAPMGFDARFRRLWDVYLTSCAAGFSSGNTTVAQAVLAREG